MALPLLVRRNLLAHPKVEITPKGLIRSARWQFFLPRSECYTSIAIFLFSGLMVCFLTSCVAFKKGYEDATLESKEHELKVALSQIRDAISQYRSDHGHPPFALNDVIDAGYLNEFPQDPFTGKTDWVPVWTECPPTTANCKKTIGNIHSAAIGKATDGTLYKDW